MAPGIPMMVFIMLGALHTTRSILNGSEKRNFTNEKEVTRNISQWKNELIQQISQINHRELEGINADNEVTAHNPTSIEVRPDSNLYAEAGQGILINFEVTNNQNKYIFYRFEAFTDGNINAEEYVKPLSSGAPPHSKVLVRVEISQRYNLRETSRGLLTFKAKWISLFEEQVTQEVYYYIGTQKPDSTGPTISYSFNGDCSGYLHPKQCHDKIWKADISIQDADSGLLYIKTNPVGLILNKKFIVGTKEEVSGYYRANCCQTKVDIMATDISGNENTINIDIEKRWLSTAEITSIVLGLIVLIILIIAIIACIINYCKRRKQTLSIYPDTLRS